MDDLGVPPFMETAHYVLESSKEVFFSFVIGSSILLLSRSYMEILLAATIGDTTAGSCNSNDLGPYIFYHFLCEKKTCVWSEGLAAPLVSHQFFCVPKDGQTRKYRRLVCIIV